MFFWNSLAFSMIQQMLAMWSLVLCLYKSILHIWKFFVHIVLKPSLENFEHYFASMWNECNCVVQFSSVAQSCPTFCNPRNRSMPGLLVHHQLLESTQTHVHWVGDAIQPSHPLSSPSPSALNLSQHQGLCQRISSSHQVAKVLEFQLQHQSFQWTPRTDLL